MAYVLAGDARQTVSQWAQESASQLATSECEDTCRIITGHDADVPGSEHGTYESIVRRNQERTTIGVRVAETQGCANGSYGSSALAPCQMTRSRFANPIRPMIAGLSTVPGRPFTMRCAWRVSRVRITSARKAPG